MNRRATPILLAVALLLGLAAWWSQRSRSGSPSHGPTRSTRLLPAHPQDLLQIRVRRDYWNTFTLARRADASWELIEPAREPARADAVESLVNTLATLPILQRIDLPADDSERHRHYGLWEPRVTVQVLTANRQHLLRFGTETPDQAGVYCALEGRDDILVTSRAALDILELDLDHYRAGQGITALP